MSSKRSVYSHPCRPCLTLWAHCRYSTRSSARSIDSTDCLEFYRPSQIRRVSLLESMPARCQGDRSERRAHAILDRQASPIKRFYGVIYLALQSITGVELTKLQAPRSKINSPFQMSYQHIPRLLYCYSLHPLSKAKYQDDRTLHMSAAVISTVSSITYCGAVLLS